MVLWEKRVNMARTLTPLSEKQIKDYEKNIKHAYRVNDKQGIKRWKRLFLVYIKRRGYDVSSFKDYGIYQYFIEREKPKLKKADILKMEIKEIKKEITKYHIRTYLKIEKGKSALSQLPKRKQEFIKRYAEEIQYHPTMLLEPEIIDSEAHKEYLEKIKNGADPDDTIDEGIMQRPNTLALMALLELLNEVKQDAIMKDTEYANEDKERLNLIKKLTTKKHALEYLENKKNKMREYRKQLKRTKE
jgi:hypothetical protein